MSAVNDALTALEALIDTLIPATFKKRRNTQPTMEEWEQTPETHLPLIAVVTEDLDHDWGTATIGPYAGAVESSWVVSLYIYAREGDDPNRTIINLYDTLYAAIMADPTLTGKCVSCLPQGMQPQALRPYIGARIPLEITVDHGNTSI